MRILVCEYVTGGGMPADRPIPASLAREGDMMLGALLGDLLDVPGVELVVTRDARLAPLSAPVHSICTEGPPASWILWEELTRSVDAVWPIAPETDGALERLTRLVESSGSRLLNSRADAVAVTASKSATASALAAAGLAVAPVWPLDGSKGDGPKGSGPWVVKPDDGAGCLDTSLLRDPAEWTRWRAATDGAGFVVQPFVAGEPASLSLLCRDGRAWLLTVNRQQVELSGSSFVYRGGIVGGLMSSRELARLAQGVASALPGLRGCVGIDFIATPNGPVVLEVNPRLTTSYVGLRRATGMNVAAAVLGLLGDPSISPTMMSRIEPVHVNVEATVWNAAV